MEKIISEAETRMKKAVTALQEEFNTLRTGRASSALFDKIRVEYYGDPTPLNQVATISVPEARLVVIQPWDKSIIGDRLRARHPQSQKAEAVMACNILNRMSGLGMPESLPVGT